MRKLELELHKKAVEDGMTRKIINLSYDAQSEIYRAYCEVASDMDESTQTYIYVPGNLGLSEENVCRIILSTLVAFYVGEDFDKTKQRLIEEATDVKTKKSNKGASKEEAKAEPKPAKQRGTTRKKAAKKTKESEPEQTEEKPVEAGEDKKEEKPKKRAKKERLIPYDRTQAEHKKELAKVLNANFPGWSENKDIALRAKSASEDLVGVALFDSKGEVLPTFAESVLELMS